MTKRPKQHQLEDLSRTKYELAIPDNWVFRNKEKDYGIDAEVEIFDDDDRATGLVYWVQLKATESKVMATVRKVYLSIKSIKYYKSLDIPVLIARYSKAHDCFYYKWAYELDLYYAKEKAKTLRVNFSETDMWDVQSPKEVKKFLEKIRFIKGGLFKLPIPISIIVKDSVINKVPKGIFISSFRIALDSFSDFLVPKSNPKDSLLLATFSNNKLVISLSSIASCTFHGINKNEPDDFIEGVVVRSLLGFAHTLSRIGQFESMARIVLHKNIKKRFSQNKELMNQLLPIALGTSYFDVALDVVSEAIVEEQDNTLEMITQVALVIDANPDDEEKSNKIEAFLNKCLEKYSEIGDKSQIGICHFNLGTHYKNRELTKKSIYHYLKARKYEDKYLNDSHYYQQLGAALFNYGKYGFSTTMYKKALEKGAPESVKPLYADALMHSGNYQLAFDAFSEYLSSDKKEHYEWKLKAICLETLINEVGIKKQTRKKKEALNIADITKANDDNFEKLLESAIEKDLLCGLAWFNFGIRQYKNGMNEDAMFSFTFCGLLQPEDIETWVNASLCSLNQKKTRQFFPVILMTAYLKNEDRFLSKLYTEFSKNLDPISLAEVTNVIEECLPAKDKKEKPIIRLMGEDGIFRDITKVKD